MLLVVIMETVRFTMDIYLHDVTVLLKSMLSGGIIRIPFEILL